MCRYQGHSHKACFLYNKVNGHQADADRSSRLPKQLQNSQVGFPNTRQNSQVGFPNTRQNSQVGFPNARQAIAAS